MDHAMRLGNDILSTRRCERPKTGLLFSMLVCLASTSALAQQANSSQETGLRGDAQEAPLAAYLRQLNGESEAPIAQNTLDDSVYQPATQRASEREVIANNPDKFALPDENDALPLQAQEPDFERGNNVLSNQLETQRPANNLAANSVDLREDVTDDNSEAIAANANDSEALDPRQTGTIGDNEGQTERRSALLDAAAAARAQPERPFEAQRLNRDADPYAALGIRMGLWTIRPSITTGVEMETGGSATSLTTFELDGEAEIANTSLNFDSQINATKNSASGNMEFDGQASLSAIRDLSGNMQLFGTTGFQRTRDNITNSLSDIDNEEIGVTSYDATLGLQNTAMRAQWAASLGVSRDQYDDFLALEGCNCIKDRNQTSITGTLRGGYEISPVFTPFVELSATRRITDNKFDYLGFEQSGYRFESGIGVGINLSEKLTGEASIGWLRTTYDDARIDTVDALALNALLNWEPQRDTNFSLSLSTDTNAGIGTTLGTTTTYAGAIAATQQLRDNFALTGTIGYSKLDYANSAGETQLSLRADATYQFNRTFGITGNIERSYTTDVATSDKATTTTMRLAMTLRR